MGRLLMASSALLWVVAAPALAQAQLPTIEPPAPPAPPAQEIIVTGSRIPRPNLTAVSPVTTIDAREVKLEGAVLTESLLNALPQVRPDQGLYLSNGATGTATVDLRGFGASRTLVLVNGRRLLPGDASYPAADINFVPTGLIKRVEVLTGGASSVYGSDAVAGVVNFILDTRLDGARIDGQASFYQHDNRNSLMRGLLADAGWPIPNGNRVDGGIQNIDAAYGTSFARGRGHVTVYAGYRRSDGLTQNERDYSACGLAVDTAEDPMFCGGAPSSGIGTFVVPGFGRPYHPTPDRQFAPGPAIFNFAPYNFYQRPHRRYTAGGFADLDLGNAFRPYAEIMFMDDRTTAQIAPSGNFGATATINCDNPLLSAQQLSLVCFDGNFVGQQLIRDDDGAVIGFTGTPTLFTDPTTGATYRIGKLRIQRRNVEGGPRIDDLRHRDLRLVAGAKGDLDRGISYDASYVFARVKQLGKHTNDLLISRLTSALDVIADPATGQPVCRSALSGADPACVPWDVFAVGAASAAAAAYLTVPSQIAGRVEEQVATGSVTIDLGQWKLRSPWAADAPALNIGAEYRRDKLSLDPDEHYRNADLVGFTAPVLPLRGEASAREVFAEARIPLVRRHLVEEFSIEGGYRFSWYHNASARFSSSSYKIGGDLSPIRGLRLRASQQRAVRAPNIQELFALPFNDDFERDPCAGFAPAATQQQCAASGVTPAQYGNIPRQVDDFIGYNGVAGGNLALEPEVARTRTLGVVLRPVIAPGLSLTADWFDIRLKGAIAAIGSQAIIDTCVATGDPLFCNRVHRDSQGSLWLTPQGYVDNTNANIGALETSGFDFGSSFTHSLGGIGSGNVEFQGTWTRKFSIDNGGLATPYDCAGLYGVVCGFPLPRWRHNLRVTWDLPTTLSLSLLWRHIGAVPIDSRIAADHGVPPYNPVENRIRAQNYFDLTAAARFREGLQFRIGLRNLFDRQPALVPSGQAGACGGGSCNGNTYPELYDPLGRFVFAAVTVNLRP